MPVYNAGAFLDQCLHSVLKQDFTDFELIAVDDGSKDNSLEILNKYASEDSRIKVYQNERNYGVSVTANKAIKLASADVIARMDADDIMAPGRLTAQYEFLQQHPEYVLVGGQVNLIDNDNQMLRSKSFPLEHNQIKSLMFTACPVQQATTMVNRAKLPSDFVWYEDGLNTAEEVELMFKLINYGKMANLPIVVHYYRQHPDSLSHQNPKETFRLTYIARRKGVKLHGYRPSPTAMILSEMQRIAVNVLPRGLIYPTYFKVRSLIFNITNFGRKYAKTEARLWEFSKYAIVGILTQLLDLVTYALLVGIGVNYVIADTINNPLVLGFNYLGHKFFTFGSRNWTSHEIARYVMTLIVNYIYSTSILILLVSILEVDAVLAKIITMLLIPLINFLLLKKFVFKQLKVATLNESI